MTAHRDPEPINERELVAAFNRYDAEQTRREAENVLHRLTISGTDTRDLQRKRRRDLRHADPGPERGQGHR